MTDALYAPPTPNDMPPRSLSPDAVQRQTIRDLITGTALKLAASTDVDLGGLEALAKLLDAQTRAQDANLRRSQFMDARRQREEGQR